MGKMFIIIGVVFIIIGILWTFIGRLPGDITINKGNFTLHFPIVTSIVISIILTLIMFVIGRFR
ncbi:MULTISPECIES: DUF2905 family protein [Oceanobacillus]|uniref:Membrane protein n=1 Tax=Oceanobacillus kimchii TaxID=746691 RepID=A0ABQ5TII8_9BACI|nr:MULTISPECIES: DUF2905 family protein [Oceanobacillus]MBT2598211.1 DUF2905 domain-containing protein [Oceanobacillus sp. ISL-74]MBT2651130.1 DUF2905 domain-containing protein [Oceanobacillus sp. ISL-73]MCT1575789.1 DUF2905 domain-containing protein [Oceanobacillus kimchii]MCT2135426.1 DUF2905 domain-containing protein [Oceanobacillus kimchii]OEH55535.1 hypothetical protein AQ616_04975 [Oceanobacillus sp. E9]